MSYVRSHSQYTAPDYVQRDIKKWEENKMYFSSYDKLSETNVNYDALFRFLQRKIRLYKFLKINQAC